MARLGGKKVGKKEEEAKRDESSIVSAYSKEGQLRKEESEKRFRLKPYEKVLMILGYVLMFVLAIVVIYFLEANGVF